MDCRRVYAQDGHVVATASSEYEAIEIVTNHTQAAAVPKLVDALVHARNAATVFADSKYLDTARAGLLQIVMDIDAALATTQLQNPPRGEGK
jgi:hypothetical protein